MELDIGQIWCLTKFDEICYYRIDAIHPDLYMRIVHHNRRPLLISEHSYYYPQSLLHAMKSDKSWSFVSFNEFSILMVHVS